MAQKFITFKPFLDFDDNDRLFLSGNYYKVKLNKVIQYVKNDYGIARIEWFENKHTKCRQWSKDIELIKIYGV